MSEADTKADGTWQQNYQFYFDLKTDDLGDTMLSVNAHRVSSLNPICLFYYLKMSSNIQVSLS